MDINSHILEQCRRNNRKAQYELYRECYPLLMSICSRYHRNDLDSRSVLNEGFLKIISNLDKYGPQVPFKYWIRKIMINTIIDHFRKEKQYNDHITHAETSHLILVSEAEIAIEESYDTEELLNMIRKLPTVTCKVFNLFAIDGYSHFEVSQLLGISEGTSKWHVATARKKLHAMLKSAHRLPANLKSQ